MGKRENEIKFPEKGNGRAPNLNYEPRSAYTTSTCCGSRERPPMCHTARAAIRRSSASFQELKNLLKICDIFLKDILVVGPVFL